MRAAPAGRIPPRAGEDGSAFAIFLAGEAIAKTAVPFRGKLPACHLSRTAGFVCFVSFRGQKSGNQRQFA
jgi:hypothetical protein